MIGSLTPNTASPPTEPHPQPLSKGEGSDMLQGVKTSRKGAKNAKNPLRKERGTRNPTRCKGRKGKLMRVLQFPPLGEG